jgi:hypothetical protein
VPGTLAFTSQHGPFTVESLPLIGAFPAATPTPPPRATGPAADSELPRPQAPAHAAAPTRPPVAPPSPAAASVPPAPTTATRTDADAVLATLERLGELHQRGILTDAEFAAKKAELLARL